MSGRLTLVLALAGFAAFAHAAIDLPAQGKALFGAQAEPIGSGETSVRRGVFDTTVSLEGGGLDLPYTLRVARNGRLFERSFTFGLGAEVLWSPDAFRFAVTGRAQGANSRFHTAIVTLDDDTLGWLDLTPSIEHTFGNPAKCSDPEPPNLAAVMWRSNRRLVVVAQVVSRSNCESAGAFTAYEVNVVTGHVEHTYDQLDATRRWHASLGAALLDLHKD